MSDGFIESFVSAGEDGAALTNTTVATSIIPVARRILLPAGLFSRVGKQLIWRAAGRISTAPASPGTLTLDLRFGTNIVFNGGASAALATTITNLTWEAEGVLRCVAIGSAASVLGIGHLLTYALSAATPILMLPASAPGPGASFDSTASHILDLFATWSIANAANSIQLHQFSIQSGT